VGNNYKKTMTRKAIDEGESDRMERIGKSGDENYDDAAKSGYQKKNKKKKNKKKIFVPVFVPEKEKKKSEYNTRVIIKNTVGVN